MYAVGDWNDEKKMPNTVKFGMTTDRNVQKRVQSLQTGNPNKITVFSVVELDTPELASSYERLIHSKFKEFRLKGEWFACSSEIEEFIDFGFAQFGTLVSYSDIGLIKFVGGKLELMEVEVANG